MVPHLLKCGRFAVPLFVLVCRVFPLVWSPSPVHVNISLGMLGFSFCIHTDTTRVSSSVLYITVQYRLYSLY